MISRVVWLSALLLPLCWDAAFCETPKSPVLIIRSAPERPIVEVRGQQRVPELRDACPECEWIDIADFTN